MSQFGSKDAEELERMRRTIETSVRAGFSDREETLEEAFEAVRYDVDQLTEAFLQEEAARCWVNAAAALKKEQEHWPAVTDFDRLELAFRRLETAGIVCRHNFSCCDTCAAGEIRGEMRAEIDAGRSIQGAAHYNIQDTESAVLDGKLHFSYATINEEDYQALERIGHAIVEAMRHVGFQTTWNGQTDQRMSILIDWKRRTPLGS